MNPHVRLLGGLSVGWLMIRRHDKLKEREVTLPRSYLSSCYSDLNHFQCQGHYMYLGQELRLRKLTKKVCVHVICTNLLITLYMYIVH